jgi:sulfotransferase family protein
MLPNLIGVGAPKAGTTWLFQCLKEHPQIFMTPRKETNFFRAESIDGRLDEYRENFRGGERFPVVGEISVLYLHAAKAPERIAQVLPQVKLIVSLRNPIDQVYSHYWHLRRQNFHEYDPRLMPSTFEEALERYDERLVQPAYCGDALARWLRLFDRRQVHIILYDDIQARPDAVLRDLYTFAGVDPSFQPPSAGRRDADVRRGASPKSAAHDRLHTFLYQQLARRLYYRLKLVLGVNRAVTIAETLRARHVMQKLFYNDGYPPIDARVRAVLAERFSGDVRQLSALIGRDLDHWTH